MQYRIYIYYIIVFCVSYLLTHAISIFFIANKKFVNIFTRERVHFHKQKIPKVGGIIISFTLAIAYCFFLMLFSAGNVVIGGRFAATILGCIILLLVGTADDIKRVHYRIKFLFQLMAATLFIIFGLEIRQVYVPFIGVIEPGLLGNMLLIMWVIAVVNAINILDGLDGLATGIIALVSAGLFAITVTQNHRFAITSVSMLGASLAFFRFNRFPAKLFLGDSGSLVLGFLIASIALAGPVKRATFIALAPPLLVLFMPFLSITFTFIRRVWKKKNPFKPDLLHIHYRLLRTGLSQKKIVSIFHFICFISVLSGVISYYCKSRYEIYFISFSTVSMLVLYFVSVYYIKNKNRIKRNTKRRNEE